MALYHIGIRYRIVCSNCQHDLNEPWGSYATVLDKLPEDEGIYAMGFLPLSGNTPCIYMGHSTNIQGRLQEHKSPKNLAAIDVYVKQQFQQYPELFDSWKQM